MLATNSPRSGGAPDPFLPGVREGFRKRFPNDDVVISDAPDFGIDPSEIVLLDQLARGAYGIVYKGIVKGKSYAIKVQEEVPALEEQVNILVELALLKSLKHDRLVTSSGSSRIIEKRSPFEVKIMIAMELCDNGALRECLARNLSWDLRIRIARDVIEGINHMHEFKIVHRDIKTTNILITGDWRAKVCDFSFACHIDNLSKHDYVYGTDEFMAPEIALGEDFGTAADIFSYGIVLAEMITGQEPSSTFLRRSARDLFALDEEELRGAVLPECPESLEALSLMCCEKEGEFRITAAEVYDWLQSLLEDRHVSDDTIELPEKEVNDFSNVVSPIREGTVVYPKTDEAHLMRYKSSILQGNGAATYSRRNSGRSKSMNSTPSRVGAVDPTSALTPLEKERLQFGDISAVVSHSGYINYTGKQSMGDRSSINDASTDPESRYFPSSRDADTTSPSLSSMVSRVAYLELQIQELKAENKSLTRGVSALVMMSEDMKRVARENFGEFDSVSGKKRTPRSGSPRGTPTSGQHNVLRKLITHRKSRSDDASLQSSISPNKSPKFNIPSGCEEFEGMEKSFQPRHPPTTNDVDLASMPSDISGDISAEQSEPKSFAQLKQNLQTFVSSGQFAKSISSVYVDPTVGKVDEAPRNLPSSPSFDPKKGPPGAKKLFDIGSDTKLRKVGSGSSPLTSLAQEQQTSPYDRARLRPVPPPPPKNEEPVNFNKSTVPPPPPSRSSVSTAPLFSEAQLVVINEMITDAIKKERIVAEESRNIDFDVRLADERKHLVEYVDSKFHEFRSSVIVTSESTSPTMSRNMSVSFGGLYHEMYNDKEPVCQNEEAISAPIESADTTPEKADASEKGAESEPDLEMVKSKSTLSSPQLRQLAKLEDQMEVILAALAKLAPPAASEKDKEPETKRMNSPDQENVRPQRVEEENDYEHRHHDRPRYHESQYADECPYEEESRPTYLDLPPPVQTRFLSGSQSPSIQKSSSSGSYDHSHDSYHQRSSPNLHKSPLARDIMLAKGVAHGELTNAFRSFINVINHADDTAYVNQSRSEYEAGIRPGYYDLSGRPVSVLSPHGSEGRSPNVLGQQRLSENKYPQYNNTPSSRRGTGITTPLSASSTWREVETPSTNNSRLKRSPASGAQSGRTRASSKGSNVGGPGGNKYNQIGTRGTPQMLEADSTIAAVSQCRCHRMY